MRKWWWFPGWRRNWKLEKRRVEALSSIVGERLFVELMVQRPRTPNDSLDAALLAKISQQLTDIHAKAERAIHKDDLDDLIDDAELQGVAIAPEKAAATRRPRSGSTQCALHSLQHELAEAWAGCKRRQAGRLGESVSLRKTYTPPVSGYNGDSSAQTSEPNGVGTHAAEAPAPPKRKPMRANVGHTPSSVNPPPRWRLGL
jgi:hypothetical protein